MIVICKKGLSLPVEGTHGIIEFYRRGKHYKADAQFDIRQDKMVYRIKSENNRFLPMEEELFLQYFRIFSQ